MNRLLEQALAYVRQGWSVLPIHAGGTFDKSPHSPLLIATGYSRRDEEDKLRGSWKPLQTQAPTEDTVRRWFTRDTGLGIALVTGQISGRIVMDFDGEEGRAYCHELGLRPHVRTGGGYHLHLKAPAFTVKNMVGKKTAGAPDCVDIRGDGGNAVLPPTVSNKGEYLWLRSPDDIDPVDSLDITLREALGLVPQVITYAAPASGPLPAGDDRVSAEIILNWALGKLQSSTGGRNDVGNVLAWTLFNNGYSMSEVLQVGERYVSEVAHLSRPAYTMDEFVTTARSAQKAERGEPWKKEKKKARPQTPAQGLEDVYALLSPDDQERGADLLAYTWASEGRPLQDTVTYLKLLGHARAPQTVRKAYQAYEQGKTPEGTLEGFLGARRVRYG